MNNVMVIAELGVNWRNLFEADLMIKECAEAGADIVKFQAYSYNDIKGHERAEELNKILLKESDIRYLYYRACQHGVELLVTPFYPECIEWINPYVKRWKIRYSDRHNLKIIDKCLATGKVIVLSTDEKDTLVYNPKFFDTLYCISEYPPKKGHHNLTENMKGFKGASCHYPCVETALDFVRLGAEILEVHVMRDSYGDYSYCPIDVTVSLRMSELKTLCTRIQEHDY